MTNNLKKELLLAQWQTCVEMADSVSKQRTTINSIFITLNLGIIAMTAKIQKLYLSFLLITVGIILCCLWTMLINHYRQLNQIKFEIINEIEKQLPEQPFTKEHKIQKNRKNYKNSTKLEKYLPYIIILLYVIYIILIIFFKT